MVEQSAVNRSVVGSSPSFGAIFPKENDKSGESCKDSPNNKPVLAGENPCPGETERDVKFPKLLKHRNRVRASIYGKTARHPYRLTARQSVDTARPAPRKIRDVGFQ